MQLSILFTPVWVFGVLIFLSWALPGNLLRYDVGNFFCSRETETAFHAAYRELRRTRQIFAGIATVLVGLIVWVRSPEWLQAIAIVAAVLIQTAIIVQHLFLARASASRPS